MVYRLVLIAYRFS